MKREDFVKYLKKQISKPIPAVSEVLEIIRRHEQAVAARKRIRGVKRSTR